ncbi:hypothetical protein [Tomitella cavernea]|uniref:Low molecular weight antigen MTB12-like C-terminal domain-containing protein n=1 Tax=Tomitella cavernea TaxID=1387982 RepID=A0ABP9C7B5_9ACTN|nr:hypothetical protein [Tomitella cavernea]
MSGRAGDGDGFGDEGYFIAADGAPGKPHALHWPTILASAGVAAVVASLILSVGIVGMRRDESAAVAQPAVVRVVADPGAGAAGPAVDPTESALPSAPVAPPTQAVPPAPAAASTGTDTAGGDGAPPSPPAEPAHATPDAEPRMQAAQPQSRAAEPQEQTEATAWAPPSPLPPDFTVPAAEPTLADLNNLVYFITATAASDEAKARNIEAGMGGVIVPNTVYNLGLFRAPRGWSRVTGPMQRQGDRITVQLHSFSAGMPGVDMPIEFVWQEGVWKLASSSLCAGVRTVGLPIYCNG